MKKKKKTKERFHEVKNELNVLFEAKRNGDAFG